MLKEFISKLDWGRVRIKRYPNRIFLCGGSKKESIREILKQYSPNYRYHYVYAEDAMNWPDARVFASDFLELEEYFAAAVKLIIIISESPGAFAEMGAFISNDYVRSRVLVVIEECFYKENSFIRYGVIQHLQGKEMDPTYQVSVIPDTQGVEWKEVLDKKQNILDLIHKSINGFPNQTTKFVPDKSSSQILLLREIIAIATILEKESLKFLYHSAIKTNQVKFHKKNFDRMLFVLEKLELVKKHVRGNKVFFSSLDNILCFQYPTQPDLSQAVDLQRKIKEDLYISGDPEDKIKVEIISPRNENLPTAASRTSFVVKDVLSQMEFFPLAPLMYKVFYIPKKREGKREIAQPTNFLKKLQRIGLAEMEKIFQVHSSAKAYIKKENGILLNAQTHLGNRYFLKLDFNDFFHSLKAKDFNVLLKRKGLSIADRVKYLKLFFMFNKQIGKKDAAKVYSVLKSRSSTNEKILNLMISEYENDFRLSIGAPSSPTLSNILMFEFDSLVCAWATSKGIVYTRYADDLTFSSKNKEFLSEIPTQIEFIISQIDYLNITLNSKKTKKVSFSNRVSITGLNITPEGKVSIGRTQKKKIRAMLYSFGDKGLTQPEVMYLKGWLFYLKAVEKQHFDYLMSKYVGEFAGLGIKSDDTGH
jgi:retron-type reverse transcriptase